MQVQIPGSPLYAQRAGERGPRVLLIQGTGVAGCGWAPQIEALRETHQLVWFDNRGVGRSGGWPRSMEQMAADAEAVLDAVGWDRAHIVGHSLGGLIAQALALRAPRRIASLSLLCTLLSGRSTLPDSLAALWLQLRTSLGTRSMRRRAFYELVTDPARPCTEAAIEELEGVFGRRLDALPRAAMAQVQILMRTDMRVDLARHRWPALVVSATDDRIAAVSEGRDLAAVLQGRFVEVPGGHAVPIQDAARINRLLADFLSERNRGGEGNVGPAAT